jgi:hypothetical protein
MDVLVVAAVAFAALGLIFLALAVRAVGRRSWLRSVGGTGGSALFFALSALGGTLAVSTQGYRGLTGEEVALTVATVPTGPQAFQAAVEFPDGRDTTFEVRGDQLLVDAHILKWRYFANVLGFRTQYELDRLTGRYADIEGERGQARTVHSLGVDKPVDLFDLVRRYSFLAFLVDAEYGSATFVAVDGPTRFQVLVSTTGLLVREIDVP